MVFKIQGNFNDDNFCSITTNIGTYFKILYCGANNSMYVSLLDISNEKNALHKENPSAALSAEGSEADGAPTSLSLSKSSGRRNNPKRFPEWR